MTQKDTIIIVDAQEQNRVIFRGVLEDEYNLLEAENGDKALILAQQYQDRIAVILLALALPGRDGYDVLKALNDQHLISKFPVIAVTEKYTAENERRAFDLGASDIIRKPFEPYVIRRRIKNTVELNLRKLHQQEIIEAQAKKLRESNSVMIDVLSSIIEYRSVETGHHVHRMRMLTKILLDAVAKVYPEYGLNEENISIISSASSMHDIGKIAIPDKILNKPGKLTKEEFEIMKTHTTKGCEILAGLARMGDREYLLYAYNICRYHHERWDGNGYPDGLKGDAIPVCAQVVSIVDCYDALTSDRVYKKAYSPEKAYNMILNGECGVFSPKLLECLKNVRGDFMRLTREYSDQESLKEPFLPERSDLSFPTADTLAMAQYKYFTLLRYLDATVVEMDCIKGMYHVVYLADPLFKPLKEGGSYWEAYHQFAVLNIKDDVAVHLAGNIRQRMMDFFQDGRLSYTQTYPVFSEKIGRQVTCGETWMRIHTDNPHQSGVMVIFRLFEKNTRSDTDISSGIGENENVQLKNLLGSIYTCRYDRWLTLTGIQPQLAQMLGYTQQEISEKFQNHLTELIYPADVERVRNQIPRQLQKGTAIEIEFRLLGKNDRIRWVLCKGQMMGGQDGEMYLHCILIDITHSRKAQDKLQKMAEHHKIILNQSNDIIRDWDLQTDTLTCSLNWEKKFGPMPKDRYSQKQHFLSHIHPEDQHRLSMMEDGLKTEAGFREIELRVADSEGRYRWNKLRATSFKEHDGKPYKAVGLLMDIDDQKRATRLLEEEAQRDGLTRLYNKVISRNKIEKQLEGMDDGDKAAMFIIDMDNFKQINDTCGHMYGDVVLQMFALEISKLFRSDDIIARVGGDEFLVFMKDIPNEKVVRARAGRILNAAATILKNNTGHLTPSCSIGISLYPKDGKTYEELFHRSDEALYDAKARGKNGVVLYERNQMTKEPGGKMSPRSAGTQIESLNSPEKLCFAMIENMLNTFYNASDYHQCIEDVLASIGHQFGLSRGYIFEENPDKKSVTNTFEWCAKGIESNQKVFINYSYDDFGGREHYIEMFNDNGSLVCPDVNLLPEYYRKLLASANIRSMFQCAIYDGGDFKGFMGVDDCVHTRFWTPEQIEIFSMAGKLLSVYILKMRMKEKLSVLEKEGDK